MKFSKEVDGKQIIIEETNKNFFNLLEREGFKEVKKTKLDK